MKEFCTCTNCSDSELGAKVNSGWAIQFMQFMPDGKLHVVFMRDVPVAAAPVPTVTVVPDTSARPIVSRPLVNAVVMGLDSPPRSVPLTNNRPPPGDTRKVNVPVGDPVLRQAYAAGKATYDRVYDENMAKIKEASKSFRPNFS